MACSVEVLGKEEELVEVVGEDVAVDLVVLLAEGWLVRNGMASQHSPLPFTVASPPNTPLPPFTVASPPIPTPLPPFTVASTPIPMLPTASATPAGF